MATRTAMSASLVLLSMLLGSPLCTSAKKFLQFEPLGERDVAAELAGKFSAERLATIEEVLRSVYTSLPKNEHGNLGHQAVRYVLHRYFVQQHGWYVRGLEPGGDSFNKLPSGAPLKGHIASDLQQRFEERSHHRGIGLHDLAQVVAALEDLVRKEASLELKEVYSVLNLPLEGEISTTTGDEALYTYMMIYLTNRNVSLSSSSEAEIKRQRFAKRYSGWAEAKAFIQRVKKNHGGSSNRHKTVNFTTVASIAAEIGEQFGSFNEGECKDLKLTLLGMENRSGKMGRIRLNDFYNKSLFTHWKFTEKIDFLRELGAVDESNASQPLIMLPNYLSASTNCLRATSVYAVCCRNECEDVLAHLEKRLAAPTALPEQIVPLVEALPSGTVAAPRELSAKLQSRLREIAHANGGEVALHGRLFAQWLHHAYPRECPYPHEAGATSPQTASEWMEKTGQSAHASKEEMQKVIEDACPAQAPCGEAETGVAQEPELWSGTEELFTAPVLVTDERRAPEMASVAGAKVIAGSLVLLAQLLVWLAVERFVITGERKTKPRMVFAFLSLLVILAATDLLDMALFFVLAAGIVLLGAARHAMAAPVPCKLEKCCV